MTDLEQRLRRDLHDRAAAADRTIDLMPGVIRRSRATRARRTALGSALAVAAIAVIALAGSGYLPLFGLGHSGSRPGKGAVSQKRPPPVLAGVPLPDLAATPPGWITAPYEDGQLSVPSSWSINGDQCPSAGAIFLGTPVARSGCALPSERAWMEPDNARPAPGSVRQSLNGIAAYRLTSQPGVPSYLVPALGVRIGAQGPLASRVVHTLTWSPLSVMTAPSAPFRPPAGWKRYQVHGISVAIPGTWPVDTGNEAGVQCALIVPRDKLVMVDASSPPGAISCPGSTGFPSAVPGVIAVYGHYAARITAFQGGGRCTERGRVRICLDQGTGEPGSSSTLPSIEVTVPGSSPVVLYIGLAGTGVQGRMIFDSIRGA
jgi:hypothetical protein